MKKYKYSAFFSVTNKTIENDVGSLEDIYRLMNAYSTVYGLCYLSSLTRQEIEVKEKKVAKDEK